MDTVYEQTVEPELTESGGYLKLVKQTQTDYNPAAFLVGTFLRRYTYAGDTLFSVGSREGLASTRIRLEMRSSDPTAHLGEFWAKLWGSEATVVYEFQPKYLEVEDTTPLDTATPIAIFDDPLGRGGDNLTRTARGFNCTRYIGNDEYIKLITDRRGNTPTSLEKFERLLFPNLNLVMVTIGRIDHFREFLPFGARRVISANGVVTDHDLDITSGRNQQYVRCIDLVIDVNAELNYGKTQITNRRLVGVVRDFINEAYRRVLQNATANFVGRIAAPGNEDEEPDKFWHRPELGIDDFVNRKEPRDENDVIALYVELCARSYIQDHWLYGLASRGQYDSRMILRRENDRDDLFKDPREADLKTVEFKYSAASIVRDFERYQKDPGDIQLLICWEEGTIGANPGFAFTDIVHSGAYEASPKRVFPRAQRVLKDLRTGYEIQVLVLKEIIEQLRDKS